MAKYYDDGVCRYLLDDSDSENATYSVEKCPRQTTEIHLPNDIDGCPVTKISALAFNCKTIISKISLPESIIEIGDFAFNSCVSIERIIIPPNVKTVGKSAFCGCFSLHTIVIPRSVESIGENAFEDSESLENIYVERGSFAHKWLSENLSGAIEDGKVCFYDSSDRSASPIYDFKYNLLGETMQITKYCGDAESVAVPLQILGCNVAQISREAFGEGISVKRVTIPKSVNFISERAFDGCVALESIEVDGENPKYTSSGGVLFDKSGKTLIRFPEGKTSRFYAIPTNVKNLSKGAFSSCRNLEGLTIPKSVTSIPEFCFIFCLSLRSVILPPSVVSIEAGAFEGCSSLSSVTVSPLLQQCDEDAFVDCANLSHIYAIPGTPSVDILKASGIKEDLICAAPAMYYTECMPYLSEKLSESGMEMSDLGSIAQELFGGKIDMSSITGDGKIGGLSDLIKKSFTREEPDKECDDDKPDDGTPDDDLPTEEKKKDTGKRRKGNISSITVIKPDGSPADPDEIEGIIHNLSNMIFPEGTDGSDDEGFEIEGLRGIINMMGGGSRSKKREKKPTKPEDPTKSTDDDSFKDFIGSFDSILERADESLNAINNSNDENDAESD